MAKRLVKHICRCVCGRKHIREFVYKCGHNFQVHIRLLRHHQHIFALQLHDTSRTYFQEFLFANWTFWTCVTSPLCKHAPNFIHHPSFLICVKLSMCSNALLHWASSGICMPPKCNPIWACSVFPNKISTLLFKRALLWKSHSHSTICYQYYFFIHLLFIGYDCFGFVSIKMRTHCISLWEDWLIGQDLPWMWAVWFIG